MLEEKKESGGGSKYTPGVVAQADPVNRLCRCDPLALVAVHLMPKAEKKLRPLREQHSFVFFRQHSSRQKRVVIFFLC